MWIWAGIHVIPVFHVFFLQNKIKKIKNMIV